MAEHNVLIIDDDKELCVLIKRSLLGENIEADFCNTGKEGLVKLKEKEYQLVILDVMMPGMDGFETLEKIREESSLPILMFTSKNDNASKVRGLRAGADDYLTKPFHMDELI
ncbi:MAG: response regulator, partial [Lachnospiraceae bacterium]|nr:response regulator [Lachnospiraceae bacterium]